jgi:hypothetical protein
MTKAFDLALFVPAPANVNDGVVVSALGPPFATQFKPLVVGSQPGVTVGASMPSANAQNQILLSGAGPGFAWGLALNPAAAASVPPATAQYQVLWADATPAWATTDLATLFVTGGAVTNAQGGSFAVGANLAFAPSTLPSTRINGTDPTRSNLDNFTLDCGTF